MSELALYRKYRSSDFSQVIGQDHVVSTITGALSSGRISHAYLFAGPRGTGKTTMARLLARSVNCVGDTKPCNKCVNCQAVINAHLDLIEIDAASNRSIDEIRELRDKIGLAPAMGKYKVYIIDEVHMLTKEAFNALLKTLEEPPPHAIFVLATTEAHKLPETIISRTQRFNFRPITIVDLEQQLAKIAASEKIAVNNEAISMIALAASGGFRDGIGMLDQLSGSSSGAITADTVRQVLGLADGAAIEKLGNLMATGDQIGALAIVDQLEANGTQIGQVINQLIQFWRGVMLATSDANKNPTDTQKSLANVVPTSKSISIIERLSTASRSAHAALLLESIIVSLAGNEPIVESNTPSPEIVKSSPPKAAKISKQLPSDTDFTPPAQNGDQWTSALVIIKQHNNSLYALLRSCSTVFKASEIVIGCGFNFHRDRLNESKNRQVIDLAVKQAFGRAIPVKIQIDPKSTPPPTTPVAELVGSALEILGGEVIDE